MPIPKPKEGETKKEFIDRCMGDETMVEEYDDDQRYQICLTAWENKEEDKKSSSPAIERRYFPACELRAVKDGDTKHIEGYAAVFNKWSEDLGGFIEKIARGAFKNTLETADVRALWNHNPDYILGRTAAGNLELKEDKHGLKMKIMPPDTQWARDLMISIERGDVKEASFGFNTIEDSWKLGKDGKPDERTLVEVALFDVSPVTFPAYTDTKVALRSLEKFKEETTAPSSSEEKKVDPLTSLAFQKEEDELLEKITLGGAANGQN